MKVVFCGSPDFALPALRAVSQRHQIAAVITQPDRVMGKRVTVPPVKTLALQLGLPVMQFESLSKEGYQQLVELNPDIIITCAFGQFLYRKVLALPKYGVINVHASLLPLYRGAAPIQSAILNGDTETGVSIMRTAFEMDSGDVLNCVKTPIGSDETAGELFERLSVIGADALVAALENITNGTAVFTPQGTGATYCTMLEKQMGLIDFSLPANKINCIIRGLNPWPSAFTKLKDGKLFKIHRAKVIEKDFCRKPGEVFVCDVKQGIYVACGSGALILTEVQEEGGKRMNGCDYALGHNLSGTVLGDNE